MLHGANRFIEGTGADEPNEAIELRSGLGTHFEVDEGEAEVVEVLAPCDECVSGRSSCYRCASCDTVLCYTCAEYHRQSKVTVDHDLNLLPGASPYPPVRPKTRRLDSRTSRFQADAQNSVRRASLSVQGNQLLQEMASLARAGGLGLSVVATSSHSAIRRGFGTVSGASGHPNVRFTGAGEEKAADKRNEEDIDSGSTSDDSGRESASASLGGRSASLSFAGPTSSGRLARGVVELAGVSRTSVPSCSVAQPQIPSSATSAASIPDAIKTVSETSLNTEAINNDAAVVPVCAATTVAETPNEAPDRVGAGASANVSVGVSVGAVDTDSADRERGRS